MANDEGNSTEVAPPKDLEIILSAIADASGRARSAWITFVVFIAYMSIVIGSTTHIQLLRIAPVELPLLGVDLPVVGFYLVASWLLVLLHLNLLLQLYFLAGRVRAFRCAIAEVEPLIRRDAINRLPPFVLNHLLAGGHLHPLAMRLFFGMMLWITTVLAPIAVLLGALLRFLPYHDELISGSQRLAGVTDLLLLWCFLPAILSHTDNLGDWWRRALDLKFPTARAALRIYRVHRDVKGGGWSKEINGWWLSQHAPGLTSLTLVSLAALSLAFLAFVVPRSGLEVTLTRHLPAALIENCPSGPCTKLTAVFFARDVGWLKRNLDLQDKTLVKESVPDSVIARLLARIDEQRERKVEDIWGRMSVRPLDMVPDTEDSSPNIHIIKDIQGLDLRGRDLRFANFRGSVLVRADLRGARLDGADFTEVSLQSADLRKAIAPRAVFRSADLEGSMLQGARLEFASFTGAILTRVSLEGATLHGSDFVSAHLNGTDFSGTHAQGAVFLTELMVGTVFRRADLVGASFGESNMAVADFSDAIMVAADLAGGNLLAATLKRADLRGADLSGSHLQSADLRNAQIGSILLVGTDLLFADLRKSDLTPLAMQEAEQFLRTLRINLGKEELLSLIEPRLRDAVGRSIDFRAASVGDPEGVAFCSTAIRDLPAADTFVCSDTNPCWAEVGMLEVLTKVGCADGDARRALVARILQEETVWATLERPLWPALGFALLECEEMGSNSALKIDVKKNLRHEVEGLDGEGWWKLLTRYDDLAATVNECYARWGKIDPYKADVTE